jgi:hypothetical protein
MQKNKAELAQTSSRKLFGGILAGVGSLMAGLLLLHATIANAEGFQVGVGVFALAKNGADIQINYRPPQSHYQFGYKYTRWTDVFDDPYTGHALTETTESLSGPTLSYLFHPESNGSYYLGFSLLTWSRTEKALVITTIPGSASTTDPYFGGGYSGSIGRFGYYKWGIFLAPTAELNTQTAISSEQSHGHIDTQLQIGITF